MALNFFQTLLCKGTKSIWHLLWWHKSPMKSLRKEFQQQSGVKLDHEPKNKNIQWSVEIPDYAKRNGLSSFQKRPKEKSTRSADWLSGSVSALRPGNQQEHVGRWYCSWLMSELLPFTLSVLLLLKKRVKATRWRVLSEVISFWPGWHNPTDPTVNKVFNVCANCKHFYPKIDISSVNSKKGMMSCHRVGRRIPGCLENIDIISEGNSTSTSISLHSSNDPEYCFPTF